LTKKAIRKKKRNHLLKGKGQNAGGNTAIVSIAVKLAEDLCESESVDLVSVESVYDGEKSILRFYIDKDGGVTLENCIAISRQMSNLLDVELVNKKGQDSGKYLLEVSSPGIDRVLLSEEDFKTSVGKKVKIKLAQKLNGQIKITGILTEFSDKIIRINAGDNIIALELQQISRAWLLGK